MFSAVELEYVAGLVEQMRGQGYPYYIARTVTESGTVYDAECVFSKEEITANSTTSFAVPAESVCYRIDSSGYTIGGSNYNQNDGPRVEMTEISGTYSFADTEFAYSNATFNSYSVLPDLRRREGSSGENTHAILLVNTLLVLIVFFALLFRR